MADDSAPIGAEQSSEKSGPIPEGPGGRAMTFLRRAMFSNLTRRILLLNLAGLIVLVSGILYLNQFRDSLIEARVESLLTQGEIIAGAIAARAAVETDSLTIDPEKLLELQAGESAFPMEREDDATDFPINPEEVAPILRRLISPTRTRARIYDREGLIILDSARLYSRGQILRSPLPANPGNREGWFESLWTGLKNITIRADLPVYEESIDGDGTIYEEVVNALTGSPSSKNRRTTDGDTIVSVAVPVQRFRAVLGVLLLSTEAGDIDSIIRAERVAIIRTFGVAAAVTLVLSMLLASTIATPLRRLAAGAERVRMGIKQREEIPDFSNRHDEIGHLSTSLREMTDALYARIEAIERFAADVSHELKNPLTSLRSAVETLPLTKKPEQQERLLAVIEHDVKRLDRLISDISDASRLDAELAREDAGIVDLQKLVEGFTATYSDMSLGKNEKVPEIRFAVREPNRRNARRTNDTEFLVYGHKGRLGQVFVNLIENARSFVPEMGGLIEIDMMRQGRDVVITVTDNGPGIPAENTERIFERFYTDRSEQEGFGQNSGLGLSISRQIIEAHGGTITASNAKETGGAVFTLRLPVLHQPRAER